MQISVDIDDPVPLFVQIIEQIKQAVVEHNLIPGQPLPSIRQLANDLNLNSKTVAKAYKLLERDAIIQSKGYRGTFIHPDAAANCGTNLKGLIAETLEQAVSHLRNEGATDSEIRIEFANIMNNRVS